jgi:serine/tyrosine/threonine adenylyltransferase
VHWMRVGFVHGVMNTDNMSILGLTIDYGPYGWLENYDPTWTPNTTDAVGRRYCFGNQPQIALWNLVQLANAIYTLIGKVEPLEQALEVYQRHYQERWQIMMAGKLGFNGFKHNHDQTLINELFSVLSLVETDMTIFFRRLAMLDVDADKLNNLTDDALMAPIESAYYLPEQLTPEKKTRIGNWLRNYINCLNQDATPTETRRKNMNAVNPKYVLRNYLAQVAIDKAEEGDFSMIGELLDLLRHPYDEQPDKEEFAQKRPEWARHRPGSSMLSCSS